MAKKTTRKQRGATSKSRRSALRKKPTRKPASTSRSSRPVKKKKKHAPSRASKPAPKTAQRAPSKSKPKTAASAKAPSAKDSVAAKHAGSNGVVKPPSAARADASRKGGAKQPLATKPKGKSKLTGRAKDGASAAPAALVPDKDGYVTVNGRRVRVISTKNITRKKVVREPRQDHASENSKPRSDKPVKTKLAPRELEHYRELLLNLRAQKLGDLSAKEAEALNSSGGNLSHMPIHMADIGTDAYDQDFMLGLAQSDRQLIRDIDSALQRIEDRTYGICLMTHKPIPKTRLNAKPWAQYTIEAVRLIENGQAG